jgi:hypothetical protein
VEVEKMEDIYQPYIKQLLKPGLRFSLPLPPSLIHTVPASGNTQISFYGLYKLVQAPKVSKVTS